MRVRERIAIENIAPPAPSARYTFGNASAEVFQRQLASRRMRIGALVGCAVLALAIVAGFLARRKKPPAPLVETAVAVSEPTIRRVIVPLPFVASRVTLDEQSRELTPAADVAAFEVPRESGLVHRVTALAVDGARAEAYVREGDGVARPEGDGFAIESLETYNEEAPEVIELPPSRNGVKRVVKRTSPGRASSKDAGAKAAAAAQTPKPIGTVKDGFTRLP